MRRTRLGLTLGVLTGLLALPLPALAADRTAIGVGSGAVAGAVVAGPIGAVAGAVIGGVVGASSERTGRRRVYRSRAARPRAVRRAAAAEPRATGSTAPTVWRDPD